MSEETKQEPVLTQDQAYLQEVLQKFNTNPEDESLKDVEKVLLGKIRETQEAISKISQEIEDLNTEIRERQEKGNGLVQQLVHLQGQSQGFLDSLLALK